MEGTVLIVESDLEFIREVIINHGYIVDGIGYMIVTGTGNVVNRFGGHGGNADKIVLKSNEYITQISGTDGNYRHANNERIISSLKIHTNLNPEGYGPYGLQRDTTGTKSFSSPMPLYGIISGFFGKDEQYLTSIGLHVNRTIVKCGPWGDLGASATNKWSMELKDDEIIKEIQINHGFIVDGIGFTVAHVSGNTYTNWFGGKGGNIDKIVLKPNEQITKLSGTEAEYGHATGDRLIYHH